MATTLTSKGQVTIPKKVREALGLGPGSKVTFDVDEHGRIVIDKAGRRETRHRHGNDRFERTRGRATIKWRTDELMRLLRPDD